VRGLSTLCGALTLLVCVASSAGCSSGDGERSDSGAATRPVQDSRVRAVAQRQIQRSVLADMRAHSTPIDRPPFKVGAACLTQTGNGGPYTLNCRATGYERPKAVRDIAGVPTSVKVASERWSARVQNGKVRTLTRARGQSIGQSMYASYNAVCGDGSSSSGDPACH
jgi:hypothetical protein